MKANELRIGNLVYGVSDMVEKVIEIKTHTLIADNAFAGLNDDFECEHEYYNPIPLTEEWLLKFGFVPRADAPRAIWDPKEYNCKRPHMILFRTPESEGGIGWRTGATTGCADVTFVHQLQNLYFALTGEELTIN